MNTLKMWMSAAVGVIGVTSVAHAQTAARPVAPVSEPSYEQAWHTLRDPEPPTWHEGIWKNWSDRFRLGETTVLIPFSTYHLRFAYPQEKIDGYTEWPWGFGLGRSRPDERGNMRDVYAMAFQDSNGKPSYMAGYQYMWTWRPSQTVPDFRIGAGYTVFLMSRSDTWSYFPFPGILPVGTIGYKRFFLETAYVPGGEGHGNVLFTFARIQF